MAICGELKAALAEMKYETATEVQAEVIPRVLAGHNVIAKSFTGSGKTAAFGVALSELIFSKKSGPVLIIGPTRELVVQVKDELRKINKHTGLRVFAVYGGHGIEGEIEALSGRVDMLCATPGRLIDHFERGTISPSHFHSVVLDEADRMLDMGFIDDIKKILSMVRPRNTHLFSATLDGKVAELIREHIPKYEEVIVKTEIIGTNIIEKRILVPRNRKFPQLVEYLKEAGKGKVLVFVSTKRWADMLKERLRERRFHAACIHGDMSQRARENALDGFKHGKHNILIATDVAARGLHIDNVDYVINYDEAPDADTHRHRIGRTGRMGAVGHAITFMSDGSDPVQQGLRSRIHVKDYRPQHERRRRRGGWESSAGEGGHDSDVKEFMSVHDHIKRGY